MRWCRCFFTLPVACAERVQWIVKPNLLFLSITFVGNELPNDVRKFALDSPSLSAPARLPVESRDGRKRVALNDPLVSEHLKVPIESIHPSESLRSAKIQPGVNGDYVYMCRILKSAWVRVGWC